MRAFLVAFAVLGFSAATVAQVSWPVEVRDVTTGAGIAGVTVDGRSSGFSAVTDSSGHAVLEVSGDDAESVLVQGNDNYNYTVGTFVPNGPRVFWLVPKASFHKTGLIPVSGTTAPIVFQGTTHSVQGPNPYTIEVEVPPNVLPEPADFWIAPVPAYAGPQPVGSDAIVASAFGQFTIELRNANGQALTKVLPAPGIRVRMSPTWYPYSFVAPHAANVPGAQYRLTATSAQWDAQPDSAWWDPVTGMVTCNLRACSWWIILLPLPFLSGDTPNPPPPLVPVAPDPELEISKADCVTSASVAATFVNCGLVSGGPMTCTLSQTGKITFSAQFVASLQLQLGISAGKRDTLLSRFNASLGLSVSSTANGGLEIEVMGQNQVTVPQGSSAGPNTTCYSGEGRMGVYSEMWTLKYGTNEFSWPIPRGIARTYCLAKDTSCSELCWTAQPATKQFTLPSSLKICDGDALKCQ